MKVLKKSQKISKRKPRPSQPETTTVSSSAHYKFGAFRLDQAERTLLRNGVKVPLTPRVFDTLLVLVQNSGRLVTKEYLLRQVWPDTFVEQANLSVNVATLRKVLGEAVGGEYIETLPKHGYRFAANVISERPQEPSSLRKVKAPSDTHHRDRLHSLAVLPFYNESSDPNAEYLSYGLTESIINSLSHFRNLRITSHNSVVRYKSQEIDGRMIGRELGVKSVVAGRILQLGDTLIVRAEMVDVMTGWHLWGEHYHTKLSDVLKVEQEISEQISLALQQRMTCEAAKKVSNTATDSAQAYKAYLKGRYHWSKFDQASSNKAVAYFLQAIEFDPTYALAYAGLADCYYRSSNVYAPSRAGMPKAKAAATKALEIDDTLSEAHAAMGLIKLCYEWDWLGAEREFNRAIEINHNNAVAHQRFGLYLNLLGRFDEAKQELDLAMVIDPLSPHSYWSLALTFFLAGQYEAAIEEVRKSLEMDRDYKPALYLLGRVHEQRGELHQAIEVFEKTLSLSNVSIFLAALGHAYAQSSKEREARKVLTELREQSKKQYVSAYSEAAIHLALGDKNETFYCLEKAYEDRCEMMTWLMIDPAFESIRTNLRFTNLLRRVGLSSNHPSCQRLAGS